MAQRNAWPAARRVVGTTAGRGRSVLLINTACRWLLAAETVTMAAARRHWNKDTEYIVSSSRVDQLN